MLTSEVERRVLGDLRSAPIPEAPIISPSMPFSAPFHHFTFARVRAWHLVLRVQMALAAEEGS